MGQQDNRQRSYSTLEGSRDFSDNSGFSKEKNPEPQNPRIDFTQKPTQRSSLDSAQTSPQYALDIKKDRLPPLGRGTWQICSR